jgi:hypothetical protein
MRQHAISSVVRGIEVSTETFLACGSPFQQHRHKHKRVHTGQQDICTGFLRAQGLGWSLLVLTIIQPTGTAVQKQTERCR